MNLKNLILLTMIASMARADFGYVMTRKGGPGGGSGDTKYFTRARR